MTDLTWVKNESEMEIIPPELDPTGAPLRITAITAMDMRVDFQLCRWKKDGSIWHCASLLGQWQSYGRTKENALGFLFDQLAQVARGGLFTQ